VLTEELIQQFHKFSEKGKAYDCIDARIANHIIENNDLMVISGIPYYYVGGVFRVDEKGIMIKTLIRHCIVEEVQTAPRIKRVYELLITDYRVQREPDEINLYPKHWINFLNGMLDVKTGEMHSHSPEYRAISQIPHNYIPSLKIEDTIFYKFIQTRIPDKDNQKMLLEFMGICLFSEIFFQKFMILTGKGNCGKSVILNELLRLTGTENVSAIPLQKISDRFTTAKLLYKTVNCCGDLENSPLRDTSVIKQLTGEDLVQAEYKGGEIFFFKNRAKFIFSCNELPQVLDDRSNGFFRRLLIIRFNDEGAFIPDLDSKLNDEKELEAVICGLVEGAKQALDRGKIHESGANSHEITRMKTESDSVEAFIEESCNKGQKVRIKRPDLLAAYEDFCKCEEREPLRKTAFYKALRTKGFRETKIHGTVYFAGLELKFIETEEDPFN
jgi:P4 family phage/plasmid primase-like protien